MTVDRRHTSPGTARRDGAEGTQAGTRRASGATAGWERRSAGRRSAGRDRGQTTLDFAVGVSIFLIALTGVLLFIPGTLEPFTEGGQDNIVTANRLADQLSEGTLGDPKNPHVLNTSCAIRFFSDQTPGCHYSGATLKDRVGVLDRTNLNISLQSNYTADDSGEETLCWEDGRGLNETDELSCDTVFAIGETPPERSSKVVTARRVVTVNRTAEPRNRTDVTLIVEVW